MSIDINQQTDPIIITQNSTPLVIVQPDPISISAVATYLTIEQPGETLTIASDGPQGIQGPPGIPGADAAGSINAYIKVTDDYYATFAVDSWIDVFCDSGDVTIWLPLGTPTVIARSITIAKVDNSPYTVKVRTLDGQAMDNGTSEFDMNIPQSVLSFFWRGTQYKIY